jgi:hypothetical protein
MGDSDGTRMGSHLRPARSCLRALQRNSASYRLPGALRKFRPVARNGGSAVGGKVLWSRPSEVGV